MIYNMSHNKITDAVAHLLHNVWLQWQLVEQVPRHTDAAER
jgi:hypothetical protein